MAFVPLGSLPKANATKLGDTLEVRRHFNLLNIGSAS